MLKCSAGRPEVLTGSCSDIDCLNCGPLRQLTFSIMSCPHTDTLKPPSQDYKLRINRECRRILRWDPTSCPCVELCSPQNICLLQCESKEPRVNQAWIVQVMLIEESDRCFTVVPCKSKTHQNKKEEKENNFYVTYHFDQLWHGHLKLYNNWVRHIFHRSYVLIVVGEYHREELMLCIWTCSSCTRAECQTWINSCCIF